MATCDRFDFLDDEAALKMQQLNLDQEEAVSYAVDAEPGIKMQTLSSIWDLEEDTSYQGYSDFQGHSTSPCSNTAIIVQSVAAAVVTAMNTMMEELKKPLQSRRQMEFKSNPGTALAGIDHLEQYGQRENILIFRLEETKGEDTTRKGVELAADMGVSIRANDISVSHRLPVDYA